MTGRPLSARRVALLLAVLFGASACAQPTSGAASAEAYVPTVERTIALTIDDLPLGGRQGDLAHQRHTGIEPFADDPVHLPHVVGNQGKRGNGLGGVHGSRAGRPEEGAL